MPTGTVTTLLDAQVLAAGVDLTGQANQVAEAWSANMLTKTTYASEGWEESQPGNRSATVSMTTYLDEALDDDVLVAGASGLVVSVTASNDQGAPGYSLTAANLSELGQDWQVGQLVAQPLTFVNDGPAFAGSLLLPKAARTSGASGTVEQLGAVSASQRVRASLHVTSITGGNVAVKVQSAALVGFGSPTDRITFATLTDVGALSSSAAGAITDEHWRVTYTMTASSVTFAVIVGIS